jgi:hypothetical protein
MGQRMRYGSSSRGTQKILGMSPEEKTAEIANDSVFIPPCTQIKYIKRQ